ncbi:MAG: 4Fe-4S binding protein [Verrucomicrobiales bacterium]|nr:4Fe-4S binding protein [Verrucomicrobiales bacterium]
MSTAISRRGFFSAVSRPFHPASAAADRSGAAANEPSVLRTAVIQGRFCMALTSFCSVCTERCPVPGAMHRERGLPQVISDVCTGCGICQEVCPAPRNAVLLLPRRRAPAISSP